MEEIKTIKDLFRTRVDENKKRTFKDLKVGDKIFKLHISKDGNIDYSYLVIDEIEYDVPLCDPLEDDNYVFIKGFWNNYKDIVCQLLFKQELTYRKSLYDYGKYIDCIIFTEYSFYNIAKKMLIEQFIPFIEERIRQREKDIAIREQLINELNNEEVQ